MTAAYIPWADPLKGEPAELSEPQPEPDQEFEGDGWQAWFMPLDSRLQGVVIAFALLAVVNVVLAVVLLLDIRQLNRMIDGEFVSYHQLASNADRMVAPYTAVAALSGLAVFAWLRWFRRAYLNLDQRLRRFGPRWAEAGWIVPGMWLFRPKQIVNDLWAAADETRPPALLLVWWFGFLVFFHLFWASLLIPIDYSLEAQRVANLIEVALALISAGVLVLGCRVAVLLTERVNTAHARATAA